VLTLQRTGYLVFSQFDAVEKHACVHAINLPLGLDLQSVRIDRQHRTPEKL
jgi:hypothetical protein